MVAHIQTVAFDGMETIPVDVQVHIASGLPSFAIVGLPDKAVAESKERVRSALTSMGVSLPPKRITVNLSPADLVKEGSHFDLPIALGILTALGVTDSEQTSHYVVLGELALDGGLLGVNGILPTAMMAQGRDLGIICPHDGAGEACWAGDLDIVAPPTVLALINHLAGQSPLSRPKPITHTDPLIIPDMAEVKGQETAKRAMEIAAAGGHNLLLCGPPGSGKSMLAQRMPSILPPLTPTQALEVAVIQSIAGDLSHRGLSTRPPFRDPHHSATMPALVGGGQRIRPGEISLAHNGVLFLDELPEYRRDAIDSLRQPLETGRVSVARAKQHVTYPANFQLVGAMNPCRCGDADGIDTVCRRGAKCSLEYQSKISGPMYDRFDLFCTVPAVRVADLALPTPTETSAHMAERVLRAREIQYARYEKLRTMGGDGGAGFGVGANADCDTDGVVADSAPLHSAPLYGDSTPKTNAKLSVPQLEQAVDLGADLQQFLIHSANTLKLSARGYHRVLRVARTIADLAGEERVEKQHLMEALAYRRVSPE